MEHAEVEGKYGVTVVRPGRVGQFVDEIYPSAPDCFGPYVRTPIGALSKLLPPQILLALWDSIHARPASLGALPVERHPSIMVICLNGPANVS